MTELKDLEIISDKDLFFAKVRPNAIIPTKREEDAGRDVYACFDDDYMVIPAHTTKLIPTGIASAMSSKYEIRLRDRGSNGSKGIHVNAGTIDSGYRDQWFVAWCNTNDKDVILSKLTLEELEERYGARTNAGNLAISKEPSANIMLIDSERIEAIGLDDEDLTTYLYQKNYLPMTYKNEYGEEELKVIIYPYTKAIAQAEVCEVPVMTQYELSYEDLKSIPSERGTGSLGSSGK